MNISHTILQIKQKLNNATRIADRIEKSGTVHPIDVDSLLEELRTAYNKVYQLGWEEEETLVAEQPQMAVVPHEETSTRPTIEPEIPVIPVEIPKTEPEPEPAMFVEPQVELSMEPEPELEENLEEEGPLVEVEKGVSTTIELDFEPVSVSAQEPEPEPEVEPEPEITQVSNLSQTEVETEPVNLTPVVEDSKPAPAPIAIESALPKNLNLLPISDLRTALSINDKFSLSNKLFKGNGTEFNLFLNVLNGFDNLTEAKNYLLNTLNQNNWDSESSEFTLIQELVERRYFRS
ncbi:MAG: procyclic acidic repetitive family protein [Bacteroidia bacterium]|nr:procyclic acidic repetitive family protein [Bacteroidia bacterium]